VDLDTPPWAKRSRTSHASLTDPASPAHCTHAISCEGRSAVRVFEPKNPMPERLASLLTAGAIAHRNEICGFITSDWSVEQVVNAHLHPRNNYYFDPTDLERAIKFIYNELGSEIIGQFHTHPNGVTWPSPRDLVGWPNPVLGWRYWIVTPTEVIEWELVE